MRRRAVGVLLLAGLLAWGCSLVTDLTGFSGGDDGDAASPDGATPTIAAPDGAAPPDAPADADAAVADSEFHDDFSRPDGEALENGWIEKLPNVFFLQNGAVHKRDTPNTSYRDNIVHRPPSEDVRDVEASIEFSFAAPVNYPQIFVRAQQATIRTPNTYDGYLLYVEGRPTTAILGRQRGDVFVVTLATLALDPPLDGSARYRLRLSARGTSPVVLDAYVERRSEAGFSIVGEAHVDDVDPLRIQDAGSVGFGSNEPAKPVYDDFRARPL